MRRHKMVIRVPLTSDRGHIRLAKSGGRFDQRLKHRLKIEGRAADDLEHVGGGGLLLQRFAQLVEQTGVLDGDHGLGGKVRHQLDMLACERPDLLAIDVDCADQLIVLKHWHGDYRPIASEVDGGDYIWITLDVGLRCLDVGDVGYLLCDGETTQGTVRRGPNWLA